jgi:hypothetical protein
MIKKSIRIIARLFLVAQFYYASAVCAQATGHSATLTWTTSDGGTLFNVYRAPGACPASAPTAFPATPASFVKLNATPIGALIYTDNTITPGTFCYIVTELGSGGTPESGPSNLASATPLPSAVTITITIVK